MDIRPDSKFSTGYGYPKSVFMREPGLNKDIRSAEMGTDQDWIGLDQD